MVEMGLVERFERVGFPFKTALRLVSVLIWIKLSFEIPELLNIILSADDSLFLLIAKDVGALLGFLSNRSPNPSPVIVSHLQTLVSSTRNGSPLITDLLDDREEIRANVDANYVMLLKGGKGATLMISNDGDSQSTLNTTLNEPSSSPSSTTSLNTRSTLNPFAKPFVPALHPNRIPEDERCLYLTFSKGHPLTSSEIAVFFREMCEHFGGWKQNPSPVEKVYVHKGEEDEVALFGKIVFRNPYLPGLILGRRSELKFVVNGRTLWCKRFVPKSFRKNLSERQGESSQAAPQGALDFGGLHLQDFGGPQGGVIGYNLGGQLFQGIWRGGVSPSMPPQGVVVGAPGGVMVGPGYEGYYHGGVNSYLQGVAFSPELGGHFQVMGGGYSQGEIYSGTGTAIPYQPSGSGGQGTSCNGEGTGGSPSVEKADSKEAEEA